MIQERFKLAPFVALILRKGSQVLLIKRFNTGCGDGLYCCAGGGVDGKETVTQAAIREAHEELGITIKPEHLRVVHVLHKNGNQGEKVGFFIETSIWDGEPHNKEPHKHDDVRWFDVDKLPENILPSGKHAFKMVGRNVFYSEFGWE